MVPNKVSFGERYGDDSGWERLLEVDTHEGRIRIEIQASEMAIDLDEMEWLIRSLHAARDHLGMDKVLPDEKEADDE